MKWIISWKSNYSSEFINIVQKLGSVIMMLSLPFINWIWLWIWELMLSFILFREMLHVIFVRVIGLWRPIVATSSGIPHVVSVSGILVFQLEFLIEVDIFILEVIFWVFFDSFIILLGLNTNNVIFRLLLFIYLSLIDQWEMV